MPQHNKTILAYAYLVMTTLIWGGNAVAGKISEGIIGPLTLTTLRWFGAVIFVYIFYRKHIHVDLPILKRQYKIFIILGGVGFCLFNTFLYSALNYTSAINVVIEQGSIPLFILLGSVLFFRKTAHFTQWIGTFLGMLGVMVVATGGEVLNILETVYNIGDVLMLFACISYTAYSLLLFMKPAMHWSSYLFGAGLAAALLSIPGFCYELIYADTGDFGYHAWMLIGFVAVFPSVVAQSAYVVGVEIIGAARAGLFINLVPIFGALLSIFVLGETLHLYHLAALALVASGVILSEWGGRRWTRASVC